jgi:hypothetical protein
MADSKISALPASSTPLAGTEVLPIVQSSTTKQVSVANLTTGRAVSFASATMSTGSLVPSTAGQGVNFTANTAAAGMTSRLLNWYEEGLWTPSVDGTTSGTAGGYYFRNGLYTRIGRQVTAQATIAINGIGTLVGNFQITGLPFTSGGAYPSTYGAAVGYCNVPSAGAGYSMQARVGHASTIIDIFRETGGVSSACPVGAGFEFDVVVNYFV